MDWSRWARVAVAVSLGGALVTGCTDDDGAPSDDAASETEGTGDTEGETETEGEDDRLAMLAEVQCERMAACECGTEESDDEVCGGWLAARWEARIEQGEERELTFDAGCLDQIEGQVEAADCRWPGFGETPICASFCAVYHGDLPLGSACWADDPLVSDCAQGLACVEGQCREPCEALLGLSAGSSCRAEMGDEYETCKDGLWCSWETLSCEGLAPIGAACGNGPAQCVPEAFCDWQTNTCVGAAQEGDACDQAQCALDLFCDWNNGTSVCRAYGQAGDSCDGVPCGEGLLCSQSLVCAPPPGAGEVCANGGCAAGNVCDWEIQTCVALPDTVGATCLFADCSGGLWCDQSMDPEGECRDRTVTGEACTGHSQCETNYCPRGYCEVRPLLGEDCSEVGVCARGLVCDGLSCVETDTRGPAECVYQGW